jgi:putative membrane protein
MRLDFAHARVLSKPMQAERDDAAIFNITRPHRSLLTYYLLRCLAIPPLFPILAVPLYFRYHTMRYRFDQEGVSMRWGILFRHEIILNYARIQDIHLRSNILERWLGLARVLVQTASGSSSAEMTVEGLREFEAVRDFLYARMRGVRDAAQKSAPARPSSTEENSAAGVGAASELTSTLREVAKELRLLRAELTRESQVAEKGATRVPSGP